MSEAGRDTWAALCPASELKGTGPGPREAAWKATAGQEGWEVREGGTHAGTMALPLHAAPAAAVRTEDGMALLLGARWPTLCLGLR